MTVAPLHLTDNKDRGEARKQDTKKQNEMEISLLQYLTHNVIFFNLYIYTHDNHLTQTIKLYLKVHKIIGTELHKSLYIYILTQLLYTI